MKLICDEIPQETDKLPKKRGRTPRDRSRSEMAEESSSIKTADGGSVILEEDIDENYEPTAAEIEEYSQWLGMTSPEDDDLRWIAREGLKAPLPEHWKPCKTADGEVYYFNFSSGESVWDHPCDEYYRKLFEDEKQKRKLAKAEAANKAAQEERKKETSLKSTNTAPFSLNKLKPLGSLSKADGGGGDGGSSSKASVQEEAMSSATKGGGAKEGRVAPEGDAPAAIPPSMKIKQPKQPKRQNSFTHQPHTDTIYDHGDVVYELFSSDDTSIDDDVDVGGYRLLCIKNGKIVLDESRRRGSIGSGWGGGDEVEKPAEGVKEVNRHKDSSSFSDVLSDEAKPATVAKTAHDWDEVFELSEGEESVEDEDVGGRRLLRLDEGKASPEAERKEREREHALALRELEAATGPSFRRTSSG